MDLVAWARGEVVRGEAAALGVLGTLKRAPVAEAVAFEALVTRYGWSTARIAGHVGMTQRFVQQRLALLGLPAATLAGVAAGRVKVEAARALTQVPRAPRGAPELYDAVLRPDPHRAGGLLLCVRRGEVVVDRFPLAPGALKALIAEAQVKA